MTRRSVLWLMSVTLVAMPMSVEACTAELPATLVYEGMSTEPSKSEAAKVGQFLDQFQHLDAKCVLFEVIGLSQDPKLARARAESTKRVLVQNKMRAENVTISIVTEPTNPSLQQAAITWRMANGKWRCVPAPPKREGQPGPPCPEPNTACYLELADGTICNLYGVANPTPENYPVTSP